MIGLHKCISGYRLTICDQLFERPYGQSVQLASDVNMYILISAWYSGCTCINTVRAQDGQAEAYHVQAVLSFQS